MSYLTNKDFLLEIARGKVSGHALIRRVGLNADIDIASEQDVWSKGGNLNWQTSAQVLEAVSSDNDDESTAGTGARTIKIWGLDSSYNIVNQTLSMNGTTSVDLSTDLIYVDRAELLTCGTSETNEGVIDIQLDGAGAVVASIPAEFGQTCHASYFVPAGKTAYLIGWWSSLYKAVSGSAELRLYTCEDGVGWRVQAIQELTQTGSGVVSTDSQDLLLALPEKTRIKVRAKTSADNMGVISSLTFVLVDD